MKTTPPTTTLFGVALAALGSSALLSLDEYLVLRNISYQIPALIYRHPVTLGKERHADRPSL